ncbi:MAG: GDP-mannose 4,6-dehydratase [Planctomycetota bacterium]
MRILITGGCGFLATNFIYYLLKTQPDVKIINIDKVSYYSNKLLTKDIPPQYTFKKNNINNYKKIEEVFRQFLPDTVINFAAETHVDRSFYTFEEFLRTNIKGTCNLFKLCVKYKIKKFVHISTDEVFGEIVDKNIPTEMSKNFSPSNPYSATKASAELLLSSLSKTFNYPLSIIRTNNNYGPYQFPEKLIPLTILLLSKNKKVPVYGDGKQKRRWIYVSDFCNGLRKIIQTEENGVYHLATKTELENIEVVKKICKLLNKSEKYIEFVQDRPSHDRSYALDFSLTSKILNWEPRISFDEGIARTVNWYIKNYDWLNKTISSKAYIKYLKIHYNIDLE